MDNVSIVRASDQQKKMEEDYDRDKDKGTFKEMEYEIKGNSILLRIP